MAQNTERFRKALETVLDKTESYCEDWESGIDDGTYDTPAIDETQPDEVRTAIAFLRGVLLPGEMMSGYDAWLYAASWGSAMTGGDPGACLYGFSEDFRVYNEKHRSDCIDQMRGNRKYVEDHPEHYDDDELEKIDSLIKTLHLAESKDE